MTKKVQRKLPAAERALRRAAAKAKAAKAKAARKAEGSYTRHGTRLSISRALARARVMRPVRAAAGQRAEAAVARKAWLQTELCLGYARAQSLREGKTKNKTKDRGKAEDKGKDKVKQRWAKEAPIAQAAKEGHFNKDERAAWRASQREVPVTSPVEVLEAPRRRECGGVPESGFDLLTGALRVGGTTRVEVWEGKTRKATFALSEYGKHVEMIRRLDRRSGKVVLRGAKAPEADKSGALGVFDPEEVQVNGVGADGLRIRNGGRRFIAGGEDVLQVFTWKLAKAEDESWKDVALYVLRDRVRLQKERLSAHFGEKAEEELAFCSDGRLHLVLRAGGGWLRFWEEGLGAEVDRRAKKLHKRLSRLVRDHDAACEVEGLAVKVVTPEMHREWLGLAEEYSPAALERAMDGLVLIDQEIVLGLAAGIDPDAGRCEEGDAEWTAKKAELLGKAVADLPSPGDSEMQAKVKAARREIAVAKVMARWLFLRNAGAKKALAERRARLETTRNLSVDLLGPLGFVKGAALVVPGLRKRLGADVVTHPANVKGAVTGVKTWHVAVSDYAGHWGANTNLQFALSLPTVFSPARYHKLWKLWLGTTMAKLLDGGHVESLTTWAEEAHRSKEAYEAEDSLGAHMLGKSMIAEWLALGLGQEDSAYFNVKLWKSLTQTAFLEPGRFADRPHEFKVRLPIPASGYHQVISWTMARLAGWDGAVDDRTLRHSEELGCGVASDARWAEGKLCHGGDDLDDKYVRVAVKLAADCTVAGQTYRKDEVCVLVLRSPNDRGEWNLYGFTEEDRVLWPTLAKQLGVKKLYTAEVVKDPDTRVEGIQLKEHPDVAYFPAVDVGTFAPRPTEALPRYSIRKAPAGEPKDYTLEGVYATAASLMRRTSVGYAVNTAMAATLLPHPEGSAWRAEARPASMEAMVDYFTQDQAVEECRQIVEWAQDTQRAMVDGGLRLDAVLATKLQVRHPETREMPELDLEGPWTLLVQEMVSTRKLAEREVLNRCKRCVQAGDLLAFDRAPAYGMIWADVVAAWGDAWKACYEGEAEQGEAQTWANRLAVAAATLDPLGAAYVAYNGASVTRPRNGHDGLFWGCPEAFQAYAGALAERKAGAEKEASPFAGIKAEWSQATPTGKALIADVNGVAADPADPKRGPCTVAAEAVAKALVYRYVIFRMTNKGTAYVWAKDLHAEAGPGVVYAKLAGLTLSKASFYQDMVREMVGRLQAASAAAAAELAALEGDAG